MSYDPYADLIVRIAEESNTFSNLGEIDTADLLDDCLNAIFELRNRADKYEAWATYKDSQTKKEMIA